MLVLPDDIIVHILLFCHERTIIILSKLSKRIGKLTEDKFWCRLLVERKKYDDYTFCYHYNNDEICYHKSYKTKFFPRNIPDKITADYDSLCQLWNIIKTLSSYEQYENYCKSKNMTEINSRVAKLLSDLLVCFPLSPHKINLYKKFSASIFGLKIALEFHFRPIKF